MVVMSGLRVDGMEIYQQDDGSAQRGSELHRKLAMRRGTLDPFSVEETYL
jgi:hypothetical protein